MTDDVILREIADLYVKSGLRHWLAGQKEHAASEWGKAGALLDALRVKRAREGESL